MKLADHVNSTQVVTAHVHPHDHLYTEGGPLDVSIGSQVQPAYVQRWGKAPFFISLDQPVPNESNFTILRVLLLTPGFSKPEELKKFKWHRARTFRMRGGTHTRLRLKARYVRTLPHPVPIGQWQGTLVTDHTTWAVYTLQKQSLKTVKVEEPRGSIIQPGDVDFVPPDSPR